MASAPNLGLRFCNPLEVKWPPQFVSEDGGLLLGVGAFDRDEAPWGRATCRLCGGGDICAGDAAVHVSEPGHVERRARLREEYVCFWQELQAPDGRPYFYDHVSHTWTFAQPRRLEQRLGIAAAAAEAPPAAAAAGTEEGLRERLLRCLPTGRAWAAVASPRPGWACEHCQRVFDTEGAAEQHVAALAGTGRNGHPGPVEQAGLPRTAAYAPVVAPPVARTAAAAGASAPVPAAAAAAAARAPQEEPSVEGDICEGAAPDGTRYWYNPRTRATDRTREGMLRKNERFYRHLMPQQQGDKRWWRWQAPNGAKQKAWSLEELYASVANQVDTLP